MLAPPVYIFYRIVKSFFPMHERDYELERLRIMYGATQQGIKKWMPLKPQQRKPVSREQEEEE
jgi:hypothetical protein